MANITLDRATAAIKLDTKAESVTKEGAPPPTRRQPVHASRACCGRLDGQGSRLASRAASPKVSVVGEASGVEGGEVNQLGANPENPVALKWRSSIVL